MIAKSKFRKMAWLLPLLFSACTAPVPVPRAGETPQRTAGWKNPTEIIIPVMITGAGIAWEKIKDRKSELPHPAPDSVLSTVLNPAGQIEQVPELIAEKNLPVAELLKTMAPPVQQFEIDPHRDTLLNCASGTVLYFPANTFNTAGDSVDIAVEEFYKMTEFISGSLSTISSGKILESGGTINITATENGKAIDVNTNESYLILFPKNTGGEMETFYGDRNRNGNMEWTPAAEKKAVPVDWTVDSMEYRVWMSDYYRPLLGFKKKWRMEGDDRNMTQYFNEEFNDIDRQYPHYEYGSGVNWKWGTDKSWSSYRISYDSTGKIVDVKLQKNVRDYDRNLQSKDLLTADAYNSHPDFDSSVIAFLMAMPPVDLSTFNLSADGSHPISFWVQGRVNHELYKERLRLKYESQKDGVVEKLPGAVVDYFILSANNTGWINCDRFVDDQRKRTQLYVESPGMKEVKYFLVFEEFNAVVCSETKNAKECFFPFAPIGEKVKLVALSYDGKQPLMSVQHTVISESKIMVKDFRPFSISELEAAIN